MRFVTRAGGLVLALLAVSDTPGSRLEPGMQLLYGSGGSEQPPWVVERVTTGVTLGGMNGCADARIHVNPGRRDAEARLYCVRGDTLFAWDTTARVHRALRPVGPGMVFELRGRTSVSRYETGGVAEERISGVGIPVVATTVTTRDSVGRAIRRLRERYSVGLMTATGGVFEVPDSTAASGWRTELAFDLVRIVPRRP